MTSVQPSIIEFLESRITEDEVSATLRECHREGCGWIPDESGYTYPCDYGLPERMTAECAAKRAIMSHFVETVKWSRDPDCPAAQSYSDIAVGFGESLHHLAAVYADHPDYQQEWAL